VPSQPLPGRRVLANAPLRRAALATGRGRHYRLRASSTQRHSSPWSSRRHGCSPWPPSGPIVGAGGAFQLTPILLLVSTRLSAGADRISLTAVFFNAGSGSIAYARQRRIDLRSGLIFAIAAIPGAVGGPRRRNRPAPRLQRHSRRAARSAGLASGCAYDGRRAVDSSRENSWTVTYARTAMPCRFAAVPPTAQASASSQVSSAWVGAESMSPCSSVRSDSRRTSRPRRRTSSWRSWQPGRSRLTP